MFVVRDLIRLSSVPRIGPRKIRALVNQFKTPTNVLLATPRELVRVRGIDKRLALSITRHKEGERFADDQLEKADRYKVRIVSLWDPEYPDLLKKIYDPPPFLFVSGSMTPSDQCSIALVGTRKPTQYGQRITELFARDLVRLGITVVSGLARGVDTIAHLISLNSSGRTLAVIGSGLDVPYPPENKSLMQKIAESGAVMSEFPMGSKPDAVNFPKRNRIISGISLGTVVIESAEDGGAMITATTALDQNREVFAVPGAVFEKKSSGPNKLIREGRAKLVTCIDDILAELRVPLKPLLGLPRETEPAHALSLFEKRILEGLSDQPTHIDVISEQSALSTSDTLVNLLSLEFKNLVKQIPGKMFFRI